MFPLCWEAVGAGGIYEYGQHTVNVQVFYEYTGIIRKNIKVLYESIYRYYRNAYREAGVPGGDVLPEDVRSSDRDIRSTHGQYTDIIGKYGPYTEKLA